MKLTDKQLDQLQLQIADILDSGATSIRLLDMFEAFLSVERMDELRNEFFNTHTEKGVDGVQVVITLPHNLFEWFKSKQIDKRKLLEDYTDYIEYPTSRDVVSQYLNETK